MTESERIIQVYDEQSTQSFIADVPFKEIHYTRGWVLSPHCAIPECSIEGIMYVSCSTTPLNR